MHTVQSQQDVDFRADLHSHTIYSDGTFTPIELIDHALSLGLKALSITDHDTVDAYLEAIPYAQSKNLFLGTGVEFSSVYKKQNVHVLGYNVNVSHPFLLEFCKMQQERRRKRNFLILEKLSRFRFQIDPKELEDLESFQRTIGRPHIAKMMVDKGYVKSVQEAFSLFLGDDKCCYVQGDSATLDEVIDVIKQSSGKVFLAHPHLFKDGRFVKEILSHAFDGIECYYARCTPEKERRWLKIAREKGWLISGGSDFHGSVKPHISLGCSWVCQSDFVKIFPQYE